ncbi:2330_t:CDS:1, partial [Rhizophagus irregularis]
WFDCGKTSTIHEEEPDDEDENENDENFFNSQTLPTRLNEDRVINEILN